MSNNETQVKKGDRVRITETFFSKSAARYGHDDQYPGLIGAVGTVIDFRVGDEAVRLRLDERTEGWNVLCVPGSGVEHFEEEVKFKVGDRVRIVSSSYTEHPSRKVGGTGTVKAVHNNELFGVWLDNSPNPDETPWSLWSFWDYELEPLIEEPEQIEDKPAFEVGDLVSIGKDKSYHGFKPGTVARVLKVFNEPDDKTLYVTTRPEGVEDPVWEQGVTAYVNYAPDSDGDEDDVRLVAKAGSEGAVLSPQPVTYQEFVDTVARDGLVTAFERFNITHK